MEVLAISAYTIQLIVFDMMLNRRVLRCFWYPAKCRRDTCLCETLACADCERSEQKVDRLLCLQIEYKSNSTNNLLSRSWNDKEYKYKMEESEQPGSEVKELDEYVFVVRVWIGEYQSCRTFLC